ncbi:MAG: hypothetical protein IKZ84_03405 [Victivallales bacterium]|nr:hypothetical protein [Victivallales bacterium]
MAETKQPTDGKAVNGLLEKRWSVKQGDSEPCFGVLRSPTRDLFESYPSGERKTVGLRLKKQAGKTIPSSIGADGPSALRMAED